MHRCSGIRARVHTHTHTHTHTHINPAGRRHILEHLTRAREVTFEVVVWPGERERERVPKQQPASDHIEWEQSLLSL